MNLVRILLLVFLIYTALKQKSEESRNVILIVTGLLAVCMMNKEGFDNIVRLKTGSDSLCPSSSYDSMNTFSDIDDSCVSGKIVNSDGTGCTDAPPSPPSPPCSETTIGSDKDTCGPWWAWGWPPFLFSEKGAVCREGNIWDTYCRSPSTS